MNAHSENSGWEVAHARAWACERLDEAKVASSQADVRELLEWACGASSQWTLPSHLNPRQEAKLRDAVEARSRRVPLQHITGRMFFRFLTLGARPGVFVVRPETEVLAGLAIDEARAVLTRRGAVRVVDLCTGSGAIALSVATEVPASCVWAVDKEEAALALARHNRDLLGVESVTIEEGDATRAHTLRHMDGTVDVVVSNPPYVPQGEMPIQPEAAADPHTALYGGSPDGTDIPKKVIRRALSLLAPGGLLLVEHSPSQDRCLRHYAARLGMVEVSTAPDLTGRMRFLSARAPIEAPRTIHDTMTHDEY